MVSIKDSRLHIGVLQRKSVLHWRYPLFPDFSSRKKKENEIDSFALFLSANEREKMIGNQKRMKKKKETKKIKIT